MLLIAVICLVMVNPPLVSAQAITWFAAQHRIYEDGRDFTRVIVELENLTKDQIDEIRFFEPGSLTPSPLVTLENSRESCEYSLYSAYRNDYWDWDDIDDDIADEDWVEYYYLSWNLYDHTLTPGTYRIEVDYDTATLSRTFDFSGYHSLPIVSLVSKKEMFRRRGGGKLDVEELSDGSLVLRWPARAVTHENTSTRITLGLGTDPGECYTSVTFKSPTHMGMFIIPIDEVLSLKDTSAYGTNGYFEFTLQIRVNDNSE